jgi:dihydrolipoamide dehydrogenase
MDRFDLVVLGAGSGLDVANGIAARGRTVALVESDRLGGTCLNRGCIPSKMLLHSADVAETIRRAGEFGIRVPGFTVDFAAIVRRVWDTVDGEAAEIERGLRAGTNPRLYQGEGRFVGPKTIRVGAETIVGETILIASGTRPGVPDIPGLSEAGFLTSDQALRLSSLPESLVILGGGYIAVEMAHFFGSLGTRVDIVQRHPRLVPREDEEVSAKFTEIVRSKYGVHTGFETESVARSGDRYEVRIRATGGGSEHRTLTAERLLVATGRVPNSDRLDVEKTGVRTDANGFVLTNEFLETNVPGIYALGDAVGHFLFKHSANLEAQYDYWNIVDPGQRVPVDYTAMPHAIFSSPPVAGVGETEQALRARGAQYRVGRYAAIDTGMGKAIEDRDGFVKILVERETDRILGCHILGHDAPTLLHEVVVAMRADGASVHHLRRAVHVHPALNEVVQRAALAVG